MLRLRNRNCRLRNVLIILHKGFIICKRFPYYWLFVRGNHRWLGSSPTKGQWCETLIFLLSVVKTNKQTNKQTVKSAVMQGPAIFLRRHSNYPFLEWFSTSALQLNQELQCKLSSFETKHSTTNHIKTEHIIFILKGTLNQKDNTSNFCISLSVSMLVPHHWPLWIFSHISVTGIRRSPTKGCVVQSICIFRFSLSRLLNT